MNKTSTSQRHANNQQHANERILTAVSSTFRSPSSIFPPGRDVSPAYVRSVDARLRVGVAYQSSGSNGIKHTERLSGLRGAYGMRGITQLAEEDVQVAHAPNEERDQHCGGP